MNLLSVIVLIQPTQQILVFNVLTNITLILLNVSGIAIHLRARLRETEVNSNRFEISLRGKISLRYKVTSLSAFT